MTSANWNLDPVHSNIGFWVRHLMVTKVHGRFTRWTGSLVFDPQAPLGVQVNVEIDAASIETQEAQRDAHLRSADFLDVEKHPKITFQSTSVERAGEQFRLKGDLTIAGRTRAVALEVEFMGQVKDPWGGDRVGFSASTSINRKDFGLTWNQLLEAGGVAVSEKVEIVIEAQAVKAALAQAV